MTRPTNHQIDWELAPDFAPLLQAVLAAPGRVIKESAAKLVAEHRVEEEGISTRLSNEAFPTPSPHEARAGRGPGRGEGQTTASEAQPSSPQPSPPSEGGEGGRQQDALAAARSYFIKRYRHAAVPGRTFKFWFKSSQARGEWRLAQALEARGVPIVRHVALGECRSWRGVEESILITEAFAGVPANEVPALPPEVIPAFIERIWRAGVVQRDLHPANLLVHPATRELRLVDLHGIVLRESPQEKDRDLMLAVARMALEIPVSPEVERLSLALRKDALWHRSKRCLKTNRDFARRSFGAWQWNVRTSALTPEMEKILREPDQFIESGRALKRGRSSTVAAGQGMVLKRYNFKKPLNLVKDLGRGSRGRRGFRKGYHLELAGLATARVLATAEHRVAGFPTRSYVLMEEIPQAVDAARWSGEPRRAARALGGLVGRLHREGFTHRDLKETNLLFDAAGVPHLIDLDGLEFVAEVGPEEAAANLRRLAEGLGAAGKLNRSNVLTFLLTYCRVRRIKPRRIFPRVRAATA